MISLAPTAALILANAAADDVDVGGAGDVVIYEGAIPATADTGITVQTALCTVTLNNPGYNEAAMVGDDAVVTLSADPSSPEATILVSDFATFARVRNGSNVVRRQVEFGGEINIADQNLTAGHKVRLQ